MTAHVSSDPSQKNVTDDPPDVLTRSGLDHLQRRAGVPTSEPRLGGTPRAQNMGTASRRAVRFTTLTAMCDVLDCSPGELLSLRDKSTAHLRSTAET